MSEENNEVNNKIEVDANEYKAMQDSIETTKAELASLVEHKNKVLDEKKKEQEKRRMMEEDTARKKGDYEQLLNSSETARKDLEDKFNTLMNKQSQERIQTEALKLASSDGMAEGNNVELLADFVGRRLKYTDEGLKVVDKDGNLTVSSLTDLKTEFMNDAKYASLITRTKAAGGSAAGNARGSASSAILSRADFASMSPADKMAAMRKAKAGDLKLID